MQKTSTTFDINIESRANQVRQSILPNWFPVHLTNVGENRKLRYPLPRHSFNAADLSLKMNIQDSIGIEKFNDAMILAKTCKNKVFHTSSNNQFSELRISNIYNEIFVLIFLMILRTNFLKASLRFRKN